MKVLVAGDPGGSLSTLFRRVAAVNNSNGPFDMLFCVGSFFCHAGKELASGFGVSFVFVTRPHARI